MKHLFDYGFEVTDEHDLPAINGEKDNIVELVEDTLGRDLAKHWMTAANAMFGGQTPEQVIAQGEPWRVRLIMREYVMIGPE